jgi:hypothetical protein
MKAQVWFDGVMWAARRAGFPGKVFGNTREEALSRVGQWFWSHPRPEVFEWPRKAKK